MGFYHDHCRFLPAMAGWFFFSALLSCYNKIVFGKHKMDFPCPLLMTSVHFLIQFLYSLTITSLCPDSFGRTVSSMSWNTYLLTSLPCALVTSFDVGLSNLSLVRITISFYTMVKASAPIFVLVSAYLFGIEKITWNLISVVVIICIGELLTVEGEVEFDTIGFLMCLGASVLSGLRWTTVQFTIQSLDPPLKTSLETMRLLSPFMFVSMIIISAAVERPWNKLAHGGIEGEKDYFANGEETMKTIGMALLGGVLAVCMITCEFWLIMQSSAMVMMIGGVTKEMVTIIIGVIFFGDVLNPTNIVGCAVVFLGAVLFKLSYRGKKDGEGGRNEGPKKFKVNYRPVQLNLTDENVQMKTLIGNDTMSMHDEPEEIEMGDLEDVSVGNLEEMDGADKWGAIERLKEQLQDENTDINKSKPIV